MPAIIGLGQSGGCAALPRRQSDWPPRLLQNATLNPAVAPCVDVPFASAPS